MMFSAAWIQPTWDEARRIHDPMCLVMSLSVKALARAMFELCL